MQDLKKEFLIKSKKIFVTIPQVEGDLKEVIKNKLLMKEKDLGGLLVAQEYHKDKGVHYHIILVYLKYKFIKSPSRFDYLLNKPTHIEKIKNFFNVVDYCKKGKNYIYFGEIFEKNYNIEKKLDASAIKNIVYTNLEKADDFNALYKHPLPEVKTYFLNHLKTLQIAFSYIKNQKRYEEIKLLKGLNQIALNFLENGEKEIAKKLNEMIEFKWLRPLKSTNLHIFSSDSNFGKSTLLNEINKLCPSYIYPPINWFQEYLNKTFHCILWDEFSLIGWDIQFLNLFLEGQPVDLPVKYSFNITKLDNPLVIMCSNRSLREHVLKKLSVKCDCFLPEDSDILCMKTQKCTVDHNASVQYKTLKSRIKEVKLDKNIFEFIKNNIKNA